jgi:Fe-S-cluster containining protein
MSERVCGTCGACCKVYKIDEPFQKAAGAWCTHWKRGSGCAIYADRPETCRRYRCAWIKGFGRDEDRPDATRVVIDSAPAMFDDKDDRALRMTEVSVGGLRSDYARRVTDSTLATNVYVLHYTIDGKRRLFLPKQRVLTPDIHAQLTAAGIEVFQ